MNKNIVVLVSVLALALVAFLSWKFVFSGGVAPQVITEEIPMTATPDAPDITEQP
jgi:hypothetical protein